MRVGTPSSARNGRVSRNPEARAANWIHLGVTTGRGKDDSTNRPNRPIKHVLGYALGKDFRQRLSQVAA